MSLTVASLPYCLVLFLCLPTLSHAEDPSLAVVKEIMDQNITVSTAPVPVESMEEQNMTQAQCLVDNQMGLIAIGSAGGLILCLLLTVVTLACQVYHLQRRVYIPRSSRSNLDLVGSSEYWANAAVAMETEGGVVGPCDNSVMLEEVKTQEEDEEEVERLGEIKEEREEREDDDDDDEEEEEGTAGGSGLSPEEKPLMQRESSSDLAQDLEDMPLVV